MIRFFVLEEATGSINIMNWECLATQNYYYFKGMFDQSYTSLHNPRRRIIKNAMYLLF